MNGREIYSGKIKAEVSVKKWSPEKFFQIMWKEALLGKQEISHKELVKKLTNYVEKNWEMRYNTNQRKFLFFIDGGHKMSSNNENLAIQRIAKLVDENMGSPSAAILWISTAQMATQTKINRP